MDEILGVLLEMERQPDEIEKNDMDDLVSQLEQESVAVIAEAAGVELQQHNAKDSQQKIIYIVADDMHLAEELSA